VAVVQQNVPGMFTAKTLHDAQARIDKFWFIG